MRWRWQSIAGGSAAQGDAPLVRGLVVEANDGTIATAGIVEGFIGAGVTGTGILVAGVSAMLAGGIALGGAKYAEEAAERDARLALIDEERLQLDRSPAEERAELAALYERKGLSPALAGQVADELTANDALAAHVDAEHGLSLEDSSHPPLFVAVAAGLSFAAGSAVPLVAALFTPPYLRIWVTFAAVLAALGVTSLILAAAGGTRIGRTLARTVVVGMVAMLLSLAAGSLFRL